MRLRHLKSFGASSALHGAVLVAALGYWGLPMVAAKGERRERDLYLEYAQVERLAAPVTQPTEPEPELVEPVTGDLPEVLEFAPPVDLPPETTFVRPDFAPTPRGMDRPFTQPRPKAEQLAAVELAPRASADPPAQEPVGEPDPVETRPTPVHNPRPRYPRRAYERRIEGAVVMEVTVAVDGSVLDVTLTESSGSGLLDRAALSAMGSWRFEPGTRDGVAVRMKLPWRLLFSLDG